MPGPGIPHQDIGQPTALAPSSEVAEDLDKGKETAIVHKKNVEAKESMQVQGALQATLITPPSHPHHTLTILISP